MADPAGVIPGRLPPEEMFPAGDERFRIGRASLPGGLALRTVECGSGSTDDVVLCVHGWACSLYTYRFVLPRLAARGARALALDLPGAGLSDKPPSPEWYTLDGQTRSVLQAMDALGVRRARLVGHSMGAPIVARLAVLAPERVSGLVLVAPVGFGHEWGVRFLEWVTPGIAAPVLPYFVPRWSVAAVFRHVYGSRYHPTARDVDEYWAPTQFPAFTRAMWQLLHAFPWTAGIREGFGGIRVPTVVMDGTQDHALFRGCVRRYAEVIAGARLLMIPESGHVVPEEAPDEVTDAVMSLGA